MSRQSIKDDIETATKRQQIEEEQFKLFQTIEEREGWTWRRRGRARLCRNCALPDLNQRGTAWSKTNKPREFAILGVELEMGGKEVIWPFGVTYHIQCFENFWNIVGREEEAVRLKGWLREYYGYMLRLKRSWHVWTKRKGKTSCSDAICKYTWVYPFISITRS